MSASAPTRGRSPEKNELLICQLRPAFANRRRDDYRQPLFRRVDLSPEESTTSDKVCLRRSRRAADIATSDEPSFVVGQLPHPHPAPANILPQEEKLIPEPQLR